MRYVITTDTHLGHDFLISTGRPPDFTERILRNLESFCQSDDILIHLGDICIGKDELQHIRLMNALSSCKKKWLVRGNHDRKSDSWYLNHGWDFVSREIRIDRFGLNILLSHIPTELGGVEWDSLIHMNIHGHFHNSDFRKHEPHIAKILDERHTLVALEYTDYQPVLLKKIVGG